MPTKTSKWRKAWRLLKWTVAMMFVTSLVYIILCRWLMPPVTLTQVGNSFSYGMHRDYVDWKHISRNVKLAAIASEDQAFTDHGGFDWDAIEKSLHPKKKGKKTRIPPGGGASTITQQVAKNVFLWQGGNYSKYIRKVPEAYFTKMIEWVWGKQRILEVYLNVIEMGPGIFGIEAASQKYFGKHAKDLSRAEAAMIIACLPNPRKFSVRPMSNRVAWRYPQIMREMNNIEDDADIQALLR